MNDVILFLLESSVILGILYLVYYTFLRKEASFNFNRFYLLGAIFISLLLPLLSLEVPSFGTSAMDQPIQQLSKVRSNYQEVVEEWSYGVIDQNFADVSTAIVGKEKNTMLILKVILIAYGVGLVAMLFRFIWTISWITKLRMKHPKTEMDEITIVKVPYQIAPFSFLNSVFVPVEMLQDSELTHILEHEKTHIKQRHSYDLLIVQLLTTVLWFNPVVWWLNKSLKTTHEYIADRNMIKKGYSLVEYQTLLLRQLISSNSFGLVHNFNLSFIKKRITMMNIQKLGGLGKFKIATVITMTVLFSLIIVQCNSKLDAQDLSLAEQTSVNLPVIQTEYTFNIKEDLRFDITIKDDQIYFKDRVFTLEGLERFDGNFPKKAQIVLGIDKDQKMKLVHDVQEVLRKKDLRLIVYLGEDESGELLTVPMLLPPLPNSKSGIKLPVLTEEYVKENNLDLLRLHLSSDTRISSKVIDQLVRRHIENGDAKYVVVGNYKENEVYGNYLTNLVSVKQGFYDIYEERAQELFGKSFYDINREREEGSEEAKQQYEEVRRGVPLALNIEKM